MRSNAVTPPNRNCNPTLTLTLINVIRISTEIQRFLPWPMRHRFTDFYENRLSSFCVILLTNKLTNADENITSLTEVITY